MRRFRCSDLKIIILKQLADLVTDVLKDIYTEAIFLEGEGMLTVQIALMSKV